MRAASLTFGYDEWDLPPLDERTPLQPARPGRSSGSKLLPPVLACGCAALMVAAVA